MNTKRKQIALPLLMAAALATPAIAQEAEPQPAPRAETSVKRSGFDLLKGETTLAGYGELHYNAPDSGTNTLDFHRFIFEINHKFDDRLELVSEVEIEHAFVSDGDGEVELEQAYISYKFAEDFDFSAGIMLLPLGYVNRYHEPPTFYSVERPEFHKVIIPTTWWEGGASLAWTPTPDIRVQAGVYGGLDASGFKAKDGVRSGRQKAFKTKGDNLALAGRVDYSGFEGIHLGLGFYNGNSNQTEAGFGSGRVSGASFEAVIDGSSFGFDHYELRAEAAFFDIAGSGELAAATGESIPGRIWGFYVEDRYDLMPMITGTDDGDGMNLHLFARLEILRLQQKMAKGVVANPAYNRDKIVAGLAFKPHPQVVFKVDYEWIEDQSDTDPPNQWNLGVGYMF